MLTHLLLTFCTINSPVVTMRELPEERSEIVSQVYFSESVSILEETQEWEYIRNLSDGYQGWIKKGQIAQSESSYPTNPIKVDRLAAHLYHVEDTIYGPNMTLPYDALLDRLETGERWIKVKTPDGTIGFIQAGDVAAPNLIPFEELPQFSQKFMGLPYTWGGRSSFGYDCSGFVQMLYRQAGIALPRDAKDQALWEGFQETSFDALSPGDLVFFGPEANKIRHVGMYIGDNRFIHATVAEKAPYIHISKLSDPDWNGSGRWAFRTAQTLK
ncbi:MAG: C40 family peptidase [Chlamydiia bacterium]|nr:C40 family peptidase [Chlamydiia bacterium]